MKEHRIKYFLFWIGISLMTIVVLELIIGGIDFLIGAVVFFVFSLPLFMKLTSFEIIDDRKLEYTILRNFFIKKRIDIKDIKSIKRVIKIEYSMVVSYLPLYYADKKGNEVFVKLPAILLSKKFAQIFRNLKQINPNIEFDPCFERLMKS